MNIMHATPETTPNSVPQDPSKRLILLVDDDTASTALQSRILRKAGHNVQVEGSIRGALQFLEKNAPDLVLVDLNFPQDQLDGKDFLLEKSSERTNRKMPIMVVSGETDGETRDNAKRLGAAGFIGKPFSVRQYEAAVVGVLSWQRQTPVPVLNIVEKGTTDSSWVDEQLDASLTSFDGFLLLIAMSTILFTGYHALLDIYLSNGNWFYSLW